MGFIGWFLLAWAVASVIATPLVGRFVASRLTTREPERAPDLTTTTVQD